MTSNEKIAIVRTLADIESGVIDDVVSVYLSLAKSAIFNRMYPFGKPDDVSDVPAQYAMLQCQLASRYWLRRGAEGEVQHSENSVSRTYATSNDEDLLSEIIQVVGV